jgi:hypothetical protein
LFQLIRQQPIAAGDENVFHNQWLVIS